MNNKSISILLLIIIASSQMVTAQPDCDDGNDDGGHGCPPGAPMPKPPYPCTACFPVVHAFDPNDIVGPTGYAQPQWMAAKDAFGYTIRFENDPDFATAPAQKVTIRMPIDSQMNAYSFQLGEFGFGFYRYQPPDNSSFYSDRLTDTADSLNVFVDVTAGVDVTRNEAFWILESVDPITGLVPEDALAGFLPVNDTSITRFNDTITKPGEGFVTFFLKPIATAQTGDSVTHQASIVFDINAPIPTNVWSNLIDAGPPESRLRPLPSFTPSNSVRLEFDGEDDPGGVGVDYYDLYVAKDDGPFFLYREQIDTNFYWFTGEAQSQYRFYTRATDYVGNKEDPKNDAETTTTLGVEKFIVIQSPEPGDQYCPGDVLPIRWTSANAGGRFDLALSLDGGLTFTPIAEGVDSLSSPYPFRIPPAIDPSAEALIQVKDNTTGEIIANSGAFFILPAPFLDLGPDVRIAAGQSVELQSMIVDENLQYQWSTGETTPAITVGEMNLYTLTVTDKNGCTATDSINLELATGIEELVHGSVRVYPNPTDREVVLSYELGQSAKVKLELTSLNGQLISRLPIKKKSAGAYTDRFDLRSLAQGNYLLRLQIGERKIQWLISKI